MAAHETKKDEREDYLPSNLKPTNYNLSYTKINFEKDFEFFGNVSIDLKVKEKANKIVLNSVDIDYIKITVKQNGNEQNIDIKKTSYDEKLQQFTIPLTSELTDGNATVCIDFKGFMNDKMKGFYRSSYKLSNGKDGICGTTQFEATDARRAFPCFDEPAMKATFSVSITIPFTENDSNLICISNMPIISEKVNDSDKTKTISFDKTPVMSSYLLAWVIGEFEYIEKKTNRGVLVRCYAAYGNKKKVVFALETAIKCLDFYENYFGINFPLPKCDMIAIPDFAAGAMENWGLITYREARLLCDETSSLSTKQDVCRVICHELAHMWFGNLVTMQWWDNLWLNEGFASFMQYFSSNTIYPNLNMWNMYFQREYAAAFRLDGMLSSHPIQVPVKKGSNADEVFDTISYCKGCSVICMLQSYLGNDDFKIGLTNYLKQFSYSNAITDDLWEYLCKQSKKPVNQIMSNWVKYQGFPVVSVSKVSDTKILFKQSRYLSSGKATEEQNKTVWNVPINIKIDGQNVIKKILLDTREKEFDIPELKNAKFFFINANSTGFYCSQYSTELLGHLLSNLSQLTSRDRICLVRDLKALAKSGVNGATSMLLDLIYASKNELEYNVWNELISAANDIYHIIDNDNNIAPKFNQIMQNVLSNIYNTLSWDKSEKNEEEKKSETQNEGSAEIRDGLFRPLIIRSMVRFNNKEAIQEALKRFEIFVNSKYDINTIQASLRTVIYDTAIKYGGDKHYAALKEYYLQTKEAVEKRQSLMSLAATNNAQKIKDTLNWILESADVRSQDKIFPFQVIARTQNGKEIAWNYLKTKWNDWQEVLGGGGFLVQALAKIPSGFVSFDKANEIETFYKNINLESCKRAMEQCVEAVRQNAQWRNIEIKNIQQWVNKRFEEVSDESVPCNGEYKKCIFFYKLNEETKDETMKNLCKEFGEMDYCYIARKKEDNQSKKLGFAKYKSTEIAQKAVNALNGKEVDGNVLKVAMARPRTKKEIDKYGDY